MTNFDIKDMNKQELEQYIQELKNYIQMMKDDVKLNHVYGKGKKGYDSLLKLQNNRLRSAQRKLKLT